MQGTNDPNRELLDAGALCRQLVDEGSVYAFLADHRTEVFPDELFEDLFPSPRGRPSIPADVMASAMILKKSRASRIDRPPTRCGAISVGRSPAASRSTTKGCITRCSGIGVNASTGLSLRTGSPMRCGLWWTPPGS